MGHDVKVMAVRKSDKILLTVAAAIVDKFVPDKDHYVNVIEELKERVLDNAVKLTKRDVSVDVNTGDNYYEGIVYLTVTGLSFENGDDGSVGRGNRVNGLITPYRPMSLEAAAGKNPVTHVGKLYNLLAFELAHKITDEGQGDIEEAWVRIVSQIGKPIDEPQVAVAQLSLADGVKIGGVKGTVDGIMDDGLAGIGKLTDKVVAGKVRVF